MLFYSATEAVGGWPTTKIVILTLYAGFPLLVRILFDLGLFF